MFKIDFWTDNAAFTNQPTPATEIRRIVNEILEDLDELSSDLETGDRCGGDCIDINGNAIGVWEYKHE